jgi:hypothetical protein
MLLLLSAEQQKKSKKLIFKPLIIKKNAWLGSVTLPSFKKGV